MSTDFEATRVVRSWLDEGVTELPDRVLDAVLDQVPATAQRRATWWPARRNPTMNAIVKAGLAAAVLAVAAFLGLNYLGGTSGVGGPGSESPPPTPEPTNTPTPAPTPNATPEGLLPEGAHVLNNGEPLEGLPTLPLTVTIPAADWYGTPGDGILTKNDSAGAPEGAGLITFFGDLYVYGDPCEWESTRPDEPATTVEELVAALTAQQSRDASEPIDVTVGGYAGKAITLHVPDDAVFDDCDRGTFGSWGMPHADTSPFRYQQDPGQIDVVYILDVDGTLTVIDTAYYEDTPEPVIGELEAIVESVSFD